MSRENHWSEHSFEVVEIIFVSIFSIFWSSGNLKRAHQPKTPILFGQCNWTYQAMAILIATLSLSNLKAKEQQHCEAPTFKNVIRVRRTPCQNNALRKSKTPLEQSHLCDALLRSSSSRGNGASESSSCWILSLQLLRGKSFSWEQWRSAVVFARKMCKINLKPLR
jgi:hypothetical protein